MNVSSRPVVWAGLTAVLLAGLYFATRLSLGEHAVGSVHNQVYHLSVPAPGPPTDPPVFRALQGDTITLVVHSPQGR